MKALAGGRWEIDGGTAGVFPGGATLRSGGTGWVLLDTDAERRVGGALAWARQQGLDALHLVVDGPEAAAVVARRAGYFAAPPQVWSVDGSSLAEPQPAPLAPPAVPSPEAELLALVMVDAGVEVVVEKGAVIGEVNGLELARVVPATGDQPARLDVGIGRFDREAFALMNPELTDAQALARAVAVVAEHRRVGAARHPLNQLVPERWLRSVVMADPALVGAAELVPVESAVPRRNLRERAPATAAGHDPDGRPVVVTCSTGADLDLVPAAADDRARHAPGARLVLALPQRDVLPVTGALAAALSEPAEVVGVPDNWRHPNGAAP